MTQALPDTVPNDAIVASDRAIVTPITAEEAGQRLDNFLFSRAKGVPKSHIYRIIRGGEVRVNKGRVDADYRLQDGDLLRMPPMRVAARPASGDGRELKSEKSVNFPVVFEDEDLLVIDKPAGVAVHGGSGISFGVIEQLRRARPAARFLELAHRLDRDTSGLLLVAKKRSMLVKLHEALRDGRIDKRYLACVTGRWHEARRQTKASLVKYTESDGERRVRVASDNDGDDAMAAHTIFHRVETFVSTIGPFALLDVELKTGRTHQIRVHLAHLDHPIVGDDKYGDFVVNKLVGRTHAAGAPVLKRMFLHAARLSLHHPRSGAKLELRAPLPPDCERFLARLRASRITQE